MVLTKEKIKNLISEEFIKFANLHGFRRVSLRDDIDYNIHLKDTETIKNVITPAIGRISPIGNYFQAAGVSLDTHLRVIEEVWEDLAHIVDISIPRAQLLGPWTYSLMLGNIDSTFSDWRKYECTAKGVTKFFKDLNASNVVGLIEKSRSRENIWQLDKLLNKNVEIPNCIDDFGLNGNGLVFRRLVIAKLANNTNYDNIVSYHRSFYAEYKKASPLEKYPDAIEALILRLSKF